MNKKLLKIGLPALMALSVSQFALAGGPIAQCLTDQPLAWPSGGVGIPFNPDLGPLGPLTNAEAVTAVSDAFAVWQAVSTSTATYVSGGTLPVDVDITNFGPFLDPVAPDGLSAIVFDDTGEIFDSLFGAGSGILGFAGPEWVNFSTCEIIEGVSFLNGPSFTDPVAALDVMVHEFGHYSGLGHTVVNGQQFIGLGDTSGPTPDDAFGAPDPFNETIATMYPFYFGVDVGTRTLHLDDSASLSAIYPAESFDDTASISGTIYMSNGTTPVTGVNVIARNEAAPFLDASSAISGDVNLDGSYVIEGLTPGANYRVYIDEILAGGFSTTLDGLFPGPEEYYNSDESSSDAVADFTVVNPSATGIDIIVNAPAPGDPLDVGLDGNVQLSLPFTFQMCGQLYDSVFVNANGSLTFGAPDSDFTESESEMLTGAPKIAALWVDLNNLAGGVVSYDLGDGFFKVSYSEVPEYIDTGSNSFEIVLKSATNTVDIHYGDISATDGLIGVSCGGAVTAGNETSSELSESPFTNVLNTSAAVFEVFNIDNPVDVANSIVRFDPTTFYSDSWAGSNDTPDTAKRLNIPFNSTAISNYTEISPVGADIDWYKFKTEGLASLTIAITNGQLDSLIALFDQDGNLIASDDDGGAGLLSRISALGLPAGGYYLAVTTFADFDLTGAGSSGGRYVLDIEESNAIELVLGDDTSEEVPLGFDFSFNGVTYSSVWVNSNGNLTFDAGDTDWSESVSEFLDGNARIAPLWDDLSPNNGGSVSVEYADGAAIIMFDSVPSFPSTGSNTFTVTLSNDGSYAVTYGDISATGGLVGTTEGNGAADPGETDMSAGGLSASGTSYELFDGADNDLSGATLDF